MQRFITLISILGFIPGISVAGTNSFDFSPDITIDLNTLIVADEDVVLDGLVLENMGAIPANAALTAFHRLENGDRLFALDTTVLLPGDQLLRPGDVGRFDGTDFTLEFDGQANGVPAGAGIDALTVGLGGKLIMSFDITLELDGAIIADEDLARFDGAGFNLFFDASSKGVNSALDLDAVHLEPSSGQLLMSFNTGGSVAGTGFADEDLLLYDSLGSNWSLAFDGSAIDTAWLAADLDATFAVLISDVIFYGGFESFINRVPE